MKERPFCKRPPHPIMQARSPFVTHSIVPGRLRDDVVDDAADVAHLVEACGGTAEQFE
jgi:hypothetical protein